MHLLQRSRCSRGTQSGLASLALTTNGQVVFESPSSRPLVNASVQHRSTLITSLSQRREVQSTPFLEQRPPPRSSQPAHCPTRHVRQRSASKSVRTARSCTVPRSRVTASRWGASLSLLRSPSGLADSGATRQTGRSRPTSDRPVSCANSSKVDGATTRKWTSPPSRRPVWPAWNGPTSWWMVSLVLHGGRRRRLGFLTSMRIIYWPDHNITYRRGLRSHSASVSLYAPSLLRLLDVTSPLYSDNSRLIYYHTFLRLTFACRMWPFEINLCLISTRPPWMVLKLASVCTRRN